MDGSGLLDYLYAPPHRGVDCVRRMGLDSAVETAIERGSDRVAGERLALGGLRYPVTCPKAMQGFSTTTRGPGCIFIPFGSIFGLLGVTG